MRRLIGLAIVMTLGVTGHATAQDADIAAGKAYATEICAECHAIRQSEDNSPLLEATPFQQVANTPGMTELALSVWLQTSHPTMPNIVLEQDDMRNVIAYIRSLKGKG